MLDQPTSDGLITRADLKETLTNLGQDGSNEALQRFFDSALASSSSLSSGEGRGGEPGINFTQFLTMFGEHLSEMDEAATLLDAFECFDEKDDGVIDADEMRYWLSEVGDRMTDAEVRAEQLMMRGTRVLSNSSALYAWSHTLLHQIDRLLSGPFMDRAGKKFDYKACE